MIHMKLCIVYMSVAKNLIPDDMFIGPQHQDFTSFKYSVIAKPLNLLLLLVKSCQYKSLKCQVKHHHELQRLQRKIKTVLVSALLDSFIDLFPD
jgi:hypothetical protein